MKVITTQIEIEAPLDVVWSALTDLESYSQWNPFIREVAGRPIEGEHLEILMDLREKGRQRYRVKVTALVPMKEFRWLGAFKFPGLIDGDHFFRLERVSLEVTRVIHTEHFSGLLVPFVWRGFLLRYLEPSFVALNRNLKARCEQRDLPTPIS